MVLSGSNCKQFDMPEIFVSNNVRSILFLFDWEGIYLNTNVHQAARNRQF